MYEISFKTHAISFAICFFCYIASLFASNDGSIVSEKKTPPTQSKTVTGAMENKLHAPISHTGKIDSKKQIKDIWPKKIYPWCDILCKKRLLVKVWLNHELANELVLQCKEADMNVVNCIKLGASIAVAESGWCNKLGKHGCFGIKWPKQDTIKESVEVFIYRWKRYWFKQLTPSSFYSKTSTPPKTRFCLSETSSNNLKSCPNGYKNSWEIFNKLDKVF